MTAGIDAISFSIPSLYLPIPELAMHRNIAPEKLTQGLGLQRMSVPDVHQDVVTMASNAVWSLMKQENLTPGEISRIYVGTESGVDSSKPVASYVISNLEQIYGQGTFRRCDVVDLTFACIGAMDAMHNCLDYIRVNPDKKAIVLVSLPCFCSDVATGQKVFSAAYDHQADVKVFVVPYDHQADLLVYKVPYDHQAGKNDGKWFFTKYDHQAGKKIYFVAYEHQADVKIYFVKYQHQAGWRNRSKMAYFY